PCRKGLRAPCRTGAFELGDRLLVPEREGDVIEALEEPPSSVIVDLEGHCELSDSRGLRNQVDGGLRAGCRLDQSPECLGVFLGDLAGEEALLAGVATKDVAEPRAQHGGEPVVAQRPDGVLTAGARAEVGPG